VRRARPLEAALSLLVHRTFPFRPASIGVASDWLGLHDPALAGSAAAVAAGRRISRPSEPYTPPLSWPPPDCSGSRPPSPCADPAPAQR